MFLMGQGRFLNRCKNIETRENVLDLVLLKSRCSIFIFKQFLVFKYMRKKEKKLLMARKSLATLSLLLVNPN